jgi:hypothetical protein
MVEASMFLKNLGTQWRKRKLRRELAEMQATKFSFMGLSDVSLRELNGLAQLLPHDREVFDKLIGLLGPPLAVILLTFLDCDSEVGGKDSLQRARQMARAALRSIEAF